MEPDSKQIKRELAKLIIKQKEMEYDLSLNKLEIEKKKQELFDAHMREATEQKERGSK